MSQFNNISFKADFDVQDAIDALTQLYKSQNDTAKSLADYAKVTVEFNKKGKVTQATIKGINDDFSAQTEKLKVTKNGVQTLNRTYDNTVNVLRKIRDGYLATGAAATKSLQDKILTPDFIKNLDTSTLGKFNTVFVDLQSKVGQFEISTNRLFELYSQTRQGIAVPMTQAEAVVVKALANIISMEERAANAALKLNEVLPKTRDYYLQIGRASATALRNEINPKGFAAGTDITAIQNFELTLSKVQLKAGQLGITADRTLQLYRDFSKGIISAVNDAELQIVKSFSAIINAHKKAELSSKPVEDLKAKYLALGKAGADLIRQQVGGFKGNTDTDAIIKYELAVANLQSKIGQFGLSSAKVVQIYQDLKRGVVSAITPAELRVTQAMQNVIKAHNEAKTSVSSFTNGFLISWQSIGRLTAIQLLHRAVSGFRSSFAAAREESLRLANSINLIQTITLKAGKTSEEWLEVIRRISDQFGSDINDVAQAAYEAIGNQITQTTTDTEKFVETTLKLSRVTQSTAKEAGAALAGLINSYQVSASSAERISSVLFKSVDLGSFVLGDVAERLGRLAPLANQLGIGLEEMAGSLAALTNEGRRADASITILRALIQKILRPTDDSAKLFEKMGFESGRAAFQVLGFSGVVAKFNEIVKREGVGALSAYFNELRGLEASVSLTTTAFGRLNEFIKEIKADARQDFLKAQIIATQEPLRKLQIEFNKIKNIITVDLAREFQKLSQKLNEQVGGFAERLKVLITNINSSLLPSIVRNLVKVIDYFGSLRSAVDLVSEAVIALINGLAAARVAAYTLGVTIGGPLYKGIQLVVTAFSLLKQVQEDAFKSQLNRGNEFLKENEKVLGIIGENIKKNTLAQISGTENALSSVRRLTLSYLNNLEQQLDKEKELIIENARTIEGEIESGLKARIQKYKDYIQELSSSIKELQREIEGNNKTVTEILSDRNKRIFDALQKQRTQEEQFVALLQKSEQLSANLRQQSDPVELKATFEEASKILEAALKIQEKREEEAKRRGQLGAASSAQDKAVKVSRTLIDLENLYISRLKERNKVNDSNIKNLEKQKDIEQQVLNQIKFITRDALKIKIFDSQGSFNDPSLTIAKYTDLITKIDNLLAKTPESVSLTKELLELRKSISEDINDTGQRIDLKSSISTAVKEIEESLRKNETNISPDLIRKLNALGVQGSTVRELRVNAEDIFNSLSKALEKATEDLVNAKVNAGTISLRERAAREGLSGALNTVSGNFKLIKELRNTVIEGDRNKLISDLRELLTFSFIKNTERPETVEALKKALEQLEGFNKESIDKAEKNFRTIQDVIDQFKASTASFLDRNIVLINSTDILSKTLIDTNIQLKELNTHFRGVPLQINGTGPAQTNGGVNVGGINVTVNGAGNPQNVADAVVKQINLGLRRGTFTFAERNA